MTEPKAWYDPEVTNRDVGLSWTPGQFHTQPLYTTPPQREFVGLTDEERDEICLGDESVARSIEAKLREKNGGQP